MATITVSEYDPAWPGLFAQFGVVLRQVLEPILGGRLKRIDHIGSTSVPGLAAKPVIDVMVSVAGLPAGPDPEQDAEYGASRPSGWWDDIVAGVEAIGYTWSGAWCMDRRKLLFNHPEPWSGPLPRIGSNLHIRCDGEFSQQAALMFRDQLRSDGAALRRYEDVKRELARRDWAGGVPEYADHKSDVVWALIREADRRAHYGWRPGPSDA